MLIIGVSSTNGFSRLAQPVQPSPAPKTFKIPARNLGWLEKQVARLNAIVKSINQRGAEFGAATASPVELKVLGDVQIPVEGKENVFVQGKEVQVIGESPSIKGWRFLATLVPLVSEDGSIANLIKSVPGTEKSLPQEYRTAEPKCDYCHQTRRRNETFVLQNIGTGEHKQIGRNCLAKFLNHTDPQMIAQLAEGLGDLEKALEGMEGGEGGDGGGGEKVVGIGPFLATISALRRSLGWKSRKAAGEAGGATADFAWMLMTQPASSNDALLKRMNSAKTPYEVRDEDRELAVKAIEWAKGLSKQPEAIDDYLWNLASAASQPVVSRGTAGIVASMLNAYEKATSPLDVSEIGKPIFARAKIEEKRPTRTGSSMYKLLADNGETLIWFASGAEEESVGSDKLAIGNYIQFEGVIQRRQPYQGVMQTYVAIKRLLGDEEFFEGQKAAVDKQKQQEQERAALPPLEPGQKLELDLTVVDAKTFEVEGFRGGDETMSIYKFVDQYGRPFFWKTKAGMELERGKTYRSKVTIGWEKLPGTNKPKLDPAGKKSLAKDRDGASIKLDKVDPIAVEGQGMVTKDDLKKKGKEVSDLQEARNAASEEMSQKRFKALESVRQKYPGESIIGGVLGDDSPSSQKALNFARESLKKAQAEASSTAPFEPPPFNEYNHAVASLSTIVSPRPQVELLAEVDALVAGAEKALQAAAGLPEEVHKAEQAYYEAKRSDYTKEREAYDYLSSLRQKARDIIESTGSKRMLDESNLTSAAYMPAGLQKLEKAKAARAKIQAGQGISQEDPDWQGSFGYQVKTTVSRPATAAEYAERATTLLANTEKAMQEFLPVAQELAAMRSRIDEMGRQLDKASKEYGDMEAARQRGKAKASSVSDWLRENTLTFSPSAP